MIRPLLLAAALLTLPACTNFRAERSLDVTNAGDTPIRLAWRQSWVNLDSPTPEPASDHMRLAPGASTTIRYRTGDRLSLFTDDFTGPTGDNTGARAAIKLDGSFTTLEAAAADGRIDVTTD